METNRYVWKISDQIYVDRVDGVTIQWYAIWNHI